MRAPYIWRALCPCCTFPSCFQAVPWETYASISRNLRSYRRRNYREPSLPATLFLLLFSPSLFERVSTVRALKRGIRIRTGCHGSMSDRFERSSKRNRGFVSRLDTRAHGVKLNLRAIFTPVHGKIGLG